MGNDVIRLLKVEGRVTTDKGDTSEIFEGREVFCAKKSVGMKETYQAFGVGLKPELKFTLSDHYDYQDEEIVEYEDVRYSVLRTFKPIGSNELELVVTRLDNPKQCEI